MKTALGIDLGGTKIYSGIVNEAGQIVASHSQPTPEKGEDILTLLVEIARGYQARYSFEGVGLGTPGLVSFPEGVILGCTPNLADWEGRNLKAFLETELSTRVQVDNDANMATYSELKLGVGRDVSDFVMLTLGTGLGSGVVINQQLQRGDESFGIGFGHMIVDPQRWCNCGQRGCLESYVSGKGLRKSYRLLGGEPGIHGPEIFDRAEAGEGRAQKACDSFLDYLAIGITNILNTLAPEAVVLGGGISRQPENRVLKPLREKVAGIMSMPFKRPDVIRIAHLNAEAGFVGGALMALEETS